MTGHEAEIFADRFAASAQHLANICRKLNQLEAAKSETEQQLYHSIGCAYRTGVISDADLFGLYDTLRTEHEIRISSEWNANVPVSSRSLAAKRQFKHLTCRNSQDGSHWIGEFPLSYQDPAPPCGTSVVYVLFRQCEPVYVGSTKDFRHRLNSHEDDGKVFDRWLAYPCADREAAYLMEVELLRQHKPSQNKKVGR